MLLLPLAIATTTIQTDKTTYILGEEVAISGACSSPNLAVGLRVVLGGNNVWIDQVNSDALAYTSKMLPSQEGSYSVFAACQGDTAVTKDFCVGTCEVTSPVCGDGSCNNGETCDTCAQDCGVCSPGDSPGGSSGGSCTPNYQCGAWSRCNSTLQQSRTCTDQRGCKPVKVEVQNCTACVESWICSGWSDCSDYNQYRTCVDEHDCGTTEVKPLLQKDCQQAIVSGPQPTQISSRLSPPPVPTPAKLSIMDQLKRYGWYLGGFVLLLLVILFVIILVRHKRESTNIDDLVDWMKKEKEMGTSDEEMLKTLASTEWTPQEIELAKGRLGGQ